MIINGLSIKDIKDHPAFGTPEHGKPMKASYFSSDGT
jgi:hypothetical protein